MTYKKYAFFIVKKTCWRCWILNARKSLL